MKRRTLLFACATLLIFLAGTACRPQVAPTLDEAQVIATWSLDDAASLTDDAASLTDDAASLTDDAETPAQAPAETATEPKQEEAGQIVRINDRVEIGAIDGALQPLEDAAPFYSGDAVRVRDGGEGLLDFGDQMRLRLFNDSRMEMIAVESDPDAPLDVRMFLVEGGFTGELLAEGGRAEFETPGGATIVVLGTDFYVAYDPQEEVTYIGNFEGSAEVRVDEDRIVVPSKTTVILPQRDHVPLTLTKEEFEQLGRELQSPVAAAVTASATPTPTVTSTSTQRPTSTPSAIPLLTATPTYTPSVIPVLTATATEELTAIPTLTATSTYTQTAIPTLTATPTYPPPDDTPTTEATPVPTP